MLIRKITTSGIVPAQSAQCSLQAVGHAPPVGFVGDLRGVFADEPGMPYQHGAVLIAMQLRRNFGDDFEKMPHHISIVGAIMTDLVEGGVR